MNMSALIGSTINIRNAPTIHPINAPKIGINAEKAITIPTSRAYGNRKIDIVITNIHPKIIASTHCPVRKLENVL